MDTLYLHQHFEYEFPYHFLPWANGDCVSLGRVWYSGVDYLLYLEKICNIIMRLNPQKVLDFGCGDGRLAYELARCGIQEIVGVDISERAIAFAKAFNIDNKKAKFYCIDIADLPEHDFDVAIAMEVLEHIPDNQIERVLQSIRQRLLPNGHFVISVPTKNLPRPAKHYRHYDEEVLREQVGHLFKIEDIKYVGRKHFCETCLRRLLVNRFFIIKWPKLVCVISKMLRFLHAGATAEDGKHLIAVLKPL